MHALLHHLVALRGPGRRISGMRRMLWCCALAFVYGLTGCKAPPPAPVAWIFPGLAPAPVAPPGIAPPGYAAPGLVNAAAPAPSRILVPVADANLVWDKLVDSVDTYFDIDREERVRMVGDVITEGRLTTRPMIGATLLEPWRSDSVGGYNRVESTLQTMRRQAIVRVLPDQSGYLVDVAVYKELADIARPQFATASAAAFRSDSSIVRYVEPVGDIPVNTGWIPQGRDPLLEQRILQDLQRKLAPPRRALARR
ncbi:MAG: hypothetical protein K1X74_18410 [Pirellulales bacterium]|nr:hypothetical protein [Pirellulales bacterium]